MNPDLMAALAQRVEGSVAVLLAGWKAGELTEDEFLALAAAAIEVAEAEGTAMADAAVAAALGTVALGLLPRPSLRAREAAGRIALEARDVVVRPEWLPTGREERVRWRGEIEAILRTPGLDREEYVEANRVLRMLDRQGIESRAPALEAAQEANGKAIRGQGSHWTRSTNSGACEVCRNLADGTALSANTQMHTHRGCACTQKPVAVPAA